MLKDQFKKFRNYSVVEYVLNEEEEVVALRFEGGVGKNREEVEKYLSLYSDFYISEDIEPLSLILEGLGFNVKIMSGGMKIRVTWGVQVVTISSLILWRIEDLDIDKLYDLDKKFNYSGRGIPLGPGMGVGFSLIKETKTQAMKMDAREMILGSNLFEDDYFPTYRAGVINIFAKEGEFYDNISSWDITSAYPASLISNSFPVTASVKVEEAELESMELRENGTILGVEGFIGLFILKVKRKENVVLSPLSPVDKQFEYFSQGSTFDGNGLVEGMVKISASLPEMLAIALTYEIVDYQILELFTHPLGGLSKDLKDWIKEHFLLRKKDLSSKIVINSLAGLSARSPLKGFNLSEMGIEKVAGIYNGSQGGIPKIMGIPRKLDQRVASYMNSWVRLRMIGTAKKALEIPGVELLYADTDSLKFRVDSNKTNIKLANFMLKMNNNFTEKESYHGLGTWKDETPEFKGGVVFFGKRFYAKSDGVKIYGTFAGCDKEVTDRLINERTLPEWGALGKMPVAWTRWERVVDGETFNITMKKTSTINYVEKGENND